MINLFYIEDHHVTVTGFRSMFRPSRSEIQLIGSAASLEEAFEKADPSTFDILLLDLWLDNKDPLLNTGNAIKHFSDKPVVIYSGEQRIHLIRKAFKLGVKAFLYKSSTKENIVRTLQRVKQGETVYPEILSKFMMLEKKSPSSIEHISLSENQLNILKLLSEGATVKEIAEKHLFLSVSSVEKMLLLLRNLFGVRTNVALVSSFRNLSANK
ncbi:MAG: response regulator transcription factor [Bacteroidota bacterium]